jgi:hypothetical protein
MHKSIAIFVILLAAVLNAPGANAQGSGKPDQSAARVAQINAEALKALRNAWAQSANASILSASDTDCTIGKDEPCNVKVEILDLYDKDQKLAFCAARTSSINIFLGKDSNKKNITIGWNLDTTKTSANATYYFAELITFDDAAKATDRTTVKLTDNDTKMSVKHKYNTKNYRHGYFPVVFQKIGNGDPIMCAAIDPKIGNN